MLTDNYAEEWMQKVGVSGPCDGSAKASVRLLFSEGWVFKTDINITYKTKEEACFVLKSKIDAEIKFNLWHPKKIWFLLEVKNAFLVCSMCPFLKTLRNLEDWDEKIKFWSILIQQNYQTMLKSNVSLDLNPSNFGLEKEELYYIDEEIYSHADMEDIGTFIVQRIPEEYKYTSKEDWIKFGMAIKSSLQNINFKNLEFICQSIKDYPLNSNMNKFSNALVKGLQI